MIAVRPRRDGSPAHWRLIGRVGAGTDVLATAPLGGTGRAAGWLRAIERLRDGDGCLRVTPESDGHYRWVLTESTGELIAQSPPVYRDGDSCRRAFGFARRAARAIVGGTVPWPRLTSAAGPADAASSPR
jgi:uncharacterized protein YegP (UPF0339 family)